MKTSLLHKGTYWQKNLIVLNNQIRLDSKPNHKVRLPPNRFLSIMKEVFPGEVNKTVA
jgi:hypothetical protein